MGMVIKPLKESFKQEILEIVRAVCEISTKSGDNLNEGEGEYDSNLHRGSIKMISNNELAPSLSGR